MASLLRVGARQASQIFRSNIVKQRAFQPAAFISTSKKNKDAATITETMGAPTNTENLAEKEENWISFGFSYSDKDYDQFSHSMVMFASITVCLCFGTFVYAYLPDFRMQDWAQREAYIELERRVSLGLPHIDPNLIDPDKVELPSDEELGDTEIII